MNKKAFTLAEVLITLSILGVVAALTIPALVNRNSDIAAQTKLKKAIAAYETAMAVNMAENESASAVFADCKALGAYFKQVDGATTCKFTTADGAYWVFEDVTKNPGEATESHTITGSALVFDAKDAPRYGVTLWNANGRVNAIGSADEVPNIPTSGVFTTIPNDITISNSRKLSTANEFMNGTLSCSKGVADTGKCSE